MWKRIVFFPGHRRAVQTLGSQRCPHLFLQNQSLLVVKRKLESDVQRISNEHEELISEFRSADERAKKAMTDVSAGLPAAAGPGCPLRTRLPQAGQAHAPLMSHYGVPAPCQWGYGLCSEASRGFSEKPNT